MKFKIGPLESESPVPPDNDWTLMKKVSICEFQIRAIPIGIITAVLIGILWTFVMPTSAFIREIRFPSTIITFTLCLLGTLIIHELIHYLFHPLNKDRNDSVIGFWPSKMFLYAQYKGEMTRGRSCIILAMPFIIISVVPLLVSIYLMRTAYWIAYTSIVNAYLSCGDLFMIIWSLRELPSGSIMKLNWWKLK